MNAEIITVGDELITGHTVDTNSAHLAAALTEAGFDVEYCTSVGDSLHHMEEVFRQALKRASLVVVTGGLGPTDDDITKKAIVRVFKRNLIFHEEVLEEIKLRFEKRGMEMPAINQNQALLPQGARFFPNRTGSALGICIAEQGKIFVALPGVPQEMKQILADELLPYLRSLKTTQRSSTTLLRTTGIGESRLAEMLAKELSLSAEIKLAYLPDYSGVKLRLIARCNNQELANEKIILAVKAIEKICGRYIYGYDNDTLPAVIGQLLKDNDKSLALAESCTGGKLGELVTSVAGASKWFKGGLVTYANDAKTALLGVDQAIIESHGAVSDECARAMAIGARMKFESSYSLAVTGIAGPDGGSEEKPVGTVFISLASAHSVKAQKFNFGSSRESIRTRAAFAALEFLRRDILDIQ